MTAGEVRFARAGYGVVPNAAAVVCVLALASCSSASSTMVPSRAASSARSTRAGGHPAPAGGRVVTADGHGWTRHGVEGPMPTPHSCRYRTAADGEPLPDPRCTPGAIDPAVTSSNLRSTVCRAGGYTATVRPPEKVTEAAKKRIMAAYGVPWSQARHYELDHLIELSAGGASDTRNLWPERDTLTMYRASPFVHNDKDQVEAVTRDAICDGKASLRAVQVDVAGDWTTAIAGLHLPAITRTR